MNTSSKVIGPAGGLCILLATTTFPHDLVWVGWLLGLALLATAIVLNPKEMRNNPRHEA